MSIRFLLINSTQSMMQFSNILTQSTTNALVTYAGTILLTTSFSTRFHRSTWMTRVENLETMHIMVSKSSVNLTVKFVPWSVKITTDILRSNSFERNDLNSSDAQIYSTGDKFVASLEYWFLGSYTSTVNTQNLGRMVFWILLLAD
ncbi:hypothetical protein NPIL_507791, partial [Nephila pilipes]